MTFSSRLNHLIPALSAKERAILMLKAWNEDKPEDPAWRRTMPANQEVELNRYIALMNAAHCELTVSIRLLRRRVRDVSLRQAWLRSILLWERHIDEIRRVIRVVVSEPICESEYAAKVAANRVKWVPIEKLAGILAGEHNAWAKEDFAENDEGKKKLKEEAWDRICDEKEQWLLDRVADGTLAARGRGKRRKIQQGALDDLVGRMTHPVPDDYLFYQVFPDSEAQEVEVERAYLKRLPDILDWNSFRLAEIVNDSSGEGDAKPRTPSQMIEVLQESMAEKMIDAWAVLRTVEQILDEIAAEFDGTDPLKPAIREMLGDTKQGLLDQKERFLALNVEVVLSEPPAEYVEEMREFISRSRN